jgi:hypothetical protein
MMCVRLSEERERTSLSATTFAQRPLAVIVQRWLSGSVFASPVRRRRAATDEHVGLRPKGEVGTGEKAFGLVLAIEAEYATRSNTASAGRSLALIHRWYPLPAAVARGRSTLKLRSDIVLVATNHPLPWGTLTYDTRKGGYVIDLDRRRLETAPSYTSSTAPNWSDRTYLNRVADFYGVPPYGS